MDQDMPNRLTAAAIPGKSRILSAVDVMESISSPRTQRPAFHQEKAPAELTESTGYPPRY
jgi:HD-GYP domain-containing protein (c-di-GMP phosphodiesterase class II)